MTDSIVEIASVIYAILKKSDLTVVEELQAGFNDNSDNHIEAFKIWLNNLEDMYEKAERIEEFENTIYHIDNLVDDAENVLCEIRGHINV